MTSKEYMTQVTAIDPYWLGEWSKLRSVVLIFLTPLLIAELGGVFYSVKEKTFEDSRSTRRRTDREFSQKAQLEMEMAKQREE